MPETTFVSPPPPPHEQSSLPSTSHLASGSSRPHADGAFSGPAGRLSVLPPLTRGSSPPSARSSSPRHHSSSSTTTTPVQPQRPTATTSRHLYPHQQHSLPPSHSYRHSSPPRNERNANTSSQDMPGSWDDDTVSRHSVINSWENPYSQYLAPDSDPDPILERAASRLPPSRVLNHSESHAAPTTSTRPIQDPVLPTLAGPSRSETQLTGTTWNDSLPTQLEDDLFVTDDAFPDSSQTSFSEIMPPTRKRNALSRENSHVAKRPRTAGSVKDEVSLSRKNSLPAAAAVDLEELFGESPPAQDNVFDEAAPEDLATIDLTEVNEVPETLKKPEEDKRIKISAFQCVICMDDVTTLTVTHCGHLYCAQCLHSSLHVEATKGKCPMCRSKIDMRPRNTYASKTKGYWPLELKLMTTTRKGKRKANPTT